VADHFHDALLQQLDLLAQHLGLALLQAHCAVAVRAGELHRGQQLGVALEEVGRVRQIVGNVVFGDGIAQGLVQRWSHGLRVQVLRVNQFRHGKPWWRGRS